jgi:predicted TIM-barrel fold metal-dependent hydrolase
MVEDRILIISSDGHAGALMDDYRPYLDPGFRDDFDDFLIDWRQRGSRNFDLPALKARLDPNDLAEWKEKMLDTGRANGFSNPQRRLEEAEQEGISAEVIFPDFGLPFHLYPNSVAAMMGYQTPDAAHRQAAYRAFNRWIADYVTIAPERFAAHGMTSWHDTDGALQDLHYMVEAGIKGIVLPEFSVEMPLFHPDYEPIWSALEDLGLVANSHAGMSSTSDRPIYLGGSPHPTLIVRFYVPEMQFFCHNILSHLIWGGVLQRHPNLTAVFTEQGSGWIPLALRGMDYNYEGSYFRSDYKEMMPLTPREYFERQCYIGSSVFSCAEIAERHEIGVDKMMLGMDFPHHEGTIIESTREYLKATVGVNDVPEPEVRRILGGNAAAVYGFDVAALSGVGARCGPRPSEILAAPDRDLFPRGDVHKPAGVVF